MPPSNSTSSLREWLLSSADVDARFIDKAVAVLEAEEVVTVKDLAIFEGLPRFEACGLSALSIEKIRLALKMWNIPYDQGKLRDFIAACDHDGDGQVSYKEFVDVLARDTVAPAAMGKRDMQSLEAMGIDAQEMLDQQLGHKSAEEKAKERAFWNRLDV